MKIKKEIWKTTSLVLIFLIFVGVILSIFVLLTTKTSIDILHITGFSVFQQSNGSEFDEGTYVNTTYNGSGVVLKGENLTGLYISKVFDAGSDANWNNLSWQGSTPTLEMLYAIDGSGAVFSSEDGISWKEENSSYGRTTDTIDMFSEGEILYITTEAHKEIWRSGDKGKSWSVVNNSFADNYLKESEGKNGKLFAIDGSGDVYVSYNKGNSWELQGDFNGAASNDAKGIAINESGAIFIVDGSGAVFLSVDEGVNWNQQTSNYGGGSGTDDLIVDSSNNLYILLNKKIYKSTDQGVNWNIINDSFTPYSQNGITLSSDSQDNFYISDAIGRVFKSTDSGITWEEIGDFNGAASNNPKGFTSIIYHTNLSFEVRNCSLADCSDGNWKKADLNNLNLTGRYFQYRVEFSSPSSSITPILFNVSLDYNLINSPPSITIISPENGATYGYNESLELNFSVNDPEGNLESCWYSLNSGPNVSIPGCQNTTIDVPEGSNTLIIYANDTEGELDSDEVTFNVQIGAPTIVLHYPIEIYLNKKEIEFNYTPTDIDLDSCELWGNFTGIFMLNKTDSSVVSGEINSFTLNLSDGSYLWNVRCNDSVGNSAFNGNKSFYVDLVAPSITLNEPKGTKNSRNIIAEWNVNDASPVNCWYNVYRGLNLEIENTSVNCSLNTAEFSVTVDADFIFNFYANDSAGNYKHSSTNFSVDTSGIESNGGGGSSGGGGGGGSFGGGAVFSPSVTGGKLEMSVVENIIAYAGEKKTLSVNVKNIGKIFLNKCKIKVKGDASSWIYSKQVEGIAPGEMKEFIFDLNIPDEIEAGDYKSELMIKCEEANYSSPFIITVPKSLKIIEIKDIIAENGILNITYTFNNTNVIGEKASVEIWLVDEEDNEIKRMVDEFSIKKVGLIERKVIMEIPKDLSGVFELYFALSSEPDKVVKKTIVIGKTPITGRAVTGNSRNKVIGYVIFIIIVLIGIIFIIREGVKEKRFRKKKTLNN